MLDDQRHISALHNSGMANVCLLQDGHVWYEDGLSFLLALYIIVQSNYAYENNVENDIYVYSLEWINE